MALEIALEMALEMAWEMAWEMAQGMAWEWLGKWLGEWLREGAQKMAWKFSIWDGVMGTGKFFKGGITLSSFLKPILNWFSHITHQMEA